MGICTTFYIYADICNSVQFILKTPSSGSEPYAVWFMPGMAMWLCLNDSILSASNSIRSYSYLVKESCISC